MSNDKLSETGHPIIYPIEVCKQRREQATEATQNLKEDLPHILKRAMELAQEKGASSWLTALPIEEFGFTLHMQEGLSRCPCAQIQLAATKLPH